VAATSGDVGVPYSSALVATGGTAPYTFAIVSGMPGGLSLNTSSGLITGTPTAAGSFSLTAKVTDAKGVVATATGGCPIAVATTPTLACVAQTTGQVGVAYNAALVRSGGSAPYTFSIVGGSLPAGLALDPSSGAISGTPTTAAAFSFQAKVVDAAGASATTAANCPITTAAAAPTLACSASTGQVGMQYSSNLVASGGTAPYKYSIASGSLPTGLSLNTTTGAITGTPTIAGPFTFTAKVIDARNSAAGTTTATCTITEGPAPLGSISGYAYADDNGNKSRDASELGIPGVTITLSGGGLSPIQTTTTAADGSYTFTGLPAATNYSVSAPSTVDRFSRTTTSPLTVNLATGANVTNVNFGYSLGQCALGYPFTSSNPLTSVVFNENTFLRTFAPSVARAGDTIKVWANDEHAMTLGVRQISVKTATGTTTANYPMSPLPASPSAALSPLVGSTIASGDQAGTDPAGRPMYPALFITDITLDPTSMAGDWQYGGTPIAPAAVFGTWKGAAKLIDKVANTVTVTPDADVTKNNWNLGPGSDAVPGTFSNEGYGTEVRWNVNDLPLVPGHFYRLQFMVHDGDQNKSGGDVGQACMLVAR
jgi:hypothetical protein